MTTLGYYCGTKDSPGWDPFESMVSNLSRISVILETDFSFINTGFLANYKIGNLTFCIAMNE